MIVILGNTNDENGNLSPIAISRCKKAIEIWNADKDRMIITTGTFGGHFNISVKSHSDILKDYLLSNGVPAGNILKNINSTNTYQDIIELRHLLYKSQKYKIKFWKSIEKTTIDIVTSDFHYARVSFYCDLLLNDIPQNYSLRIIATPVPFTVNESLLQATEKASLAQITKFPSESYQNASLEQKHYDNVSNWMITGQLATFSLGYKFIKDLSEKGTISGAEKIIAIAGLIIVITIFLMMYWGAAANAGKARLTLTNIERIYKQFGFSLYHATSPPKFKIFSFRRILIAFYFLLVAILFLELT